MIRPGRRVNWDLLADRARGVLVCSWAGHQWRDKFSGRMCRRCATFRRYP